MSKYNFDKAIDRRLTHSYKWDIPKDTLSFSIADTDFMVADEIVESINERARQSTFGYTFVPNEYYDAYIYWWNHRYGLKLKREQFVFCSGVVSAIDSILKRIAKEGDNISLFSPNYNVFYNCISNNKLTIQEVPFIYQDYRYEIDWKLLELSIAKSKAFILCNPHNPIGVQFTKEEIIRIVELCKKYDVYLLSDEIHSDLDYGKHRYIPAMLVSDYSKLIMLVSPGKTFNLAGLHSSVIVIRDEKLRTTIQEGVYHDDVGEPSFFSIEPVIAAYTKCEKYVDEENEYILENRRVLSEFLDKNGINLKIVSGYATYLLWIDISYYSHDSEEFTRRLKEEAKIVVGSGKHYHEHFSSFIRVNIATQRENILHLCNSLKDFLGGNKDEKTN